MEWMLIVIPGGIGVFAIVFGIATLLVYNDGRRAYAKEYIRRHRSEKALERRNLDRRDAELLAAAAELMRPTQQEWLEQRRRRPVAAVSSTPHADTRWSVLNGGR